ncbi:hypothetical protein NQZ68_008562 [Dissostichus eleginoides]|nr:hypothetical protein NQZ68_008562 [Dissostichus eleginoides]
MHPPHSAGEKSGKTKSTWDSLPWEQAMCHTTFHLHLLPLSSPSHHSSEADDTGFFPLSLLLCEN